MDKEYLKMVRALPDSFFEGWHWHAGDLAINMDDPYKRKVMLLTTSEQIFFKKVIIAELLYPNSMDSVKTTAPFSRLRPVPNQEQLQKMVNPDWIQAYDEFYKWTYLNPKRTDEAEEVWLMLVVEKKYNLKWGGDAWL